MKYFTLIFTLLLSSQAFAHSDHALGDGVLHMLVHAILLALLAAVAVKGISYFKNKKKLKIKS
ncbi:MAG: hypothetical protein V7782_10665 [Psychromonas sp.]